MEDNWTDKMEGWPNSDIGGTSTPLVEDIIDSTPMTSSNPAPTARSSELRTTLLQMVRLGLREGILHPNEIRKVINGEVSEAGTSDDPELKASPGRYLGKIKSYSAAKGYGFMVCTSEGEYKNKDIYIHKNVFEEIWPVPSQSRPHDVYEFDIHKNKDGKPQASRPVRMGPPVVAESFYGPGYGPPGGGYGAPPGAYPPYGSPPRGGRRGGRGRW